MNSTCIRTVFKIKSFKLNMAINEEKASTTVQIRIKIQISTIIDGIGCRQDHLYKTQDIRSYTIIYRYMRDKFFESTK